MAELVFIVWRTEPKQYFYLKHEFADESRDVVLDRRLGERRRSLRPPPLERPTSTGATVTSRGNCSRPAGPW